MSTKTDEAIALAKAWASADSSEDVPAGIASKLAQAVLYLASKPMADIGDSRRALIAATSPGAEYRAGMEAALEAVEEREGETPLNAIRAAIAALPASPEPAVGIKQALREMDFHEYAARPEPAPVVMPELRWEGQSLMLGKIRLGGTTVDLGCIPRAYDGWTVGSVTDRLKVAKGYYPFRSQPEARTAVEAAVRERLTALPALTTEEQHED